MNVLNSPLETRSYAIQAREAILDLAIGGTIELDEVLSADDISSQLGVSRTPTREALVSFGVMGIVTVKPQRGFMVNSVSPTSMSEWMRVGQLSDSKAVQRLNYDSPDDMQNVSQALGSMLVPQTEPNTRTGDSSQTSKQNKVLKADGELHAALIEDGGMTEFFGLQATIIAIKRRLYHVKHPLSADRQMAVLESGICLAQDIAASPNARSAQKALKTYYTAQFENSGLSPRYRN